MRSLRLMLATMLRLPGLRAFCVALALLLLPGCATTGVEPPGVVARRDASLSEENLVQARGEAAFRQLTEQERQRLRRIRFLAVPVDEPIGIHSQPRFMVWDSLTEQVVRADLYLLSRMPSAGTLLRLDGLKVLVPGGALPAYDP